MQFCPPLTNVDEEQLLLKNNAFIWREVKRFCIAASIDTTVHMDDLKSEATMAFLLCCRSIPVQSVELTALECRMCMQKMRSAMRVSYWKTMNMGGYNNKAIDLNRSLTFTDICTVYSDSTEESDVDSVLGLGDEEDYSSVFVSEFMSRLRPVDQTILKMRMENATYNEIASVVHICRQNLRKHLKVLAKRWKPLFQEMGFAI